MYEQIKLPYGTGDLEPYIDQLTVETHHGKHHATYLKNLNELIKESDFENLPLEEIITKSAKDPSDRKSVV